MPASVVPYLSYRDGAEALRFLEEALGFAVTVRWEDEAGAVAHAEAVHGDAAVMLGTAEHSSPPLMGSSVGHGVYLVVDDVDAAFERAQAAGADVVFGPEDTEWGTRRCRVLDPEGYEWSLGSYRPGVSP